MRAENFDISDVIDYLQGRCMVDVHDCFGEGGILNEDFTEKYLGMTGDDLTEADLFKLDCELFLCESCGWWCETSEDNDYEGQQYCTDCYEDVIYREENKDEE
jgi:hypothetical protein